MINPLYPNKETRDKVEAINKRMSELSINFSTHSNEEKTIIEFSESELEGLPEDFKNSLEKKDDKF